jgi:hypothetical protein
MLAGRSVSCAFPGDRSYRSNAPEKVLILSPYAKMDFGAEAAHALDYDAACCASTAQGEPGAEQG